MVSYTKFRGHSLVVELQLPKLVVGVRFPLPAPPKIAWSLFVLQAICFVRHCFTCAKKINEIVFSKLPQVYVTCGSFSSFEKLLDLSSLLRFYVAQLSSASSYQFSLC